MDSAIVAGLHGWAVAQPWFGSLAVLVANDGVWLLPLALLVAWFAGRPSRGPRQRAVLAGCLAAVVAVGLGLLLEHVLVRPRPFVALGIEPLVPHAADSSFPSDHTLVGVALVGALAWRVPRLGLWLLGWALLVGVARVAAALHYPSDILGSAVLAVVLDALALRPAAVVAPRLPTWLAPPAG